MYKENKSVTLRELLGMKKNGVNYLGEFKLNEQDILSIAWLRNDLSRLTFKPMARTEVRFNINKEQNTPQLTLITHDDDVIELRWIAKSITEVIGSWAGKGEVELNIIDRSELSEQFRDPKVEKELKCHVVNDKIIISTKHSYRILKIKGTANGKYRKLGLYDKVNLLYEIDQKEHNQYRSKGK